MSYTVRILANAQRDLREIETYFDMLVSHETERCLDAIESTLNWIALHAQQPPVGRLGLRHVSTDIFRYYVWYRLFENERVVQVIAILHHRRGDHALTERLP